MARQTIIILKFHPEGNELTDLTTMEQKKTNWYSRLTLIICLLTSTGIVPETFAQSHSNAVKDVDGNSYKTVVIGNQVWMKENLRTTKFNDNTDIQNITEPREWARVTTSAYSWYGNDIANKDVYGALYNWHAVNSGKLCPEGWRIPTDQDWQKLTDISGAAESGFSPVPGGYRFGNYWYPGDFYEQGINGYWWSGTEYTDTHVWSRTVNNEKKKVYRSFFAKNYGFSIRCIKNDR